MKSEIKENGDLSEEKDYPRLVRFVGEISDIVILFVKPNCGTIIYKNDDNPRNYIGEYSEEWVYPNRPVLGNFVEFDGSVTLSNDQK